MDESNKFSVTKDQVQVYERIRQSGVINMWDSRTGCALSGGMLDKDSWLYIMENYGDLIDHYQIGMGSEI